MKLGDMRLGRLGTQTGVYVVLRVSGLRAYGSLCRMQQTGQQNLFQLSCFPGSRPQYAA